MLLLLLFVVALLFVVDAVTAYAAVDISAAATAVCCYCWTSRAIPWLLPWTRGGHEAGDMAGSPEMARAWREGGCVCGGECCRRNGCGRSRSTADGQSLAAEKGG